MRRLFGAEEGRPLQRTRRARILVVVVARHHGPRSFQARPRAACRGDRLEQSMRDRGGSESAIRASDPPPAVARSEEHTSELQSLMRISYAVFCLKKTKHTY